MLSRLRPSDAPLLDLPAYRELVAGLPQPTDHQIEAFSDYVADLRGWHRYLPPWPPGEVFHFYLDPHAGFDRLVLDSAEVCPRVRTLEMCALDGVALTTSEFRARYGYLAFACTASPAIFTTDMLDGKQAILDNNTVAPLLQLDPYRSVQPPAEILARGGCHLTALIDPLFAEPDAVEHLCRIVLERGDANAGGLWGEIAKRCEAAMSNDGCRRAAEDILWLVGMERLAERCAMIEAVERMCALAYGDA